MPLDRAALAKLRARFIANITCALNTAIEAVEHNKLRSALTSLGILFGVASVIAMLAIGNGAEQEILEQMRLLGTNSIIVAPLVEQNGVPAQNDRLPAPRKFTPGLTYADAQAIHATIPQVDASSGEIVFSTLITRDGPHRSAKVVGVDSSYSRINNLTLAEGARFTPDQMHSGFQVAVIGYGVKSHFFPMEDAIGRSLKVGRNWLTVVGVLADKRVSGPDSQRLGIRDANIDVYIPAPTMLLRYRNRSLVTQAEIEAAAKVTVQDASDTSNGYPDVRAERRKMTQLDRIIVRVSEARFVPPVAQVRQRMLARWHNTVVDFEVTVPELLLKQEQRTRSIFSVVLGASASISLVVGGIGIMNIMLASVLERIREIGVRRSVGATQSDILFQFLAEAVLISAGGGVAVVFAGCVFSIAIEHVAGIKTLVSGTSVVVAFGVSCGVGLAFGIVPASRTARQHPVHCLQHE